MPERLSALDVSMLALETARTPAQVGSVHVLQPGPGGLTLEALLHRVEDRLAYVPRYRQRVRTVAYGLAAPVWVDDDAFDLTAHVRRAVLPRPGTDDQLAELTARLLGRRLDRSRPLWELYLVEGLQGGRVALVGKTHLSVVDGIDMVDLLQVLLDDAPSADDGEPTAGWRPRREPRPAELVAGAAWQLAQDPGLVVENVRGLLTGAIGAAVAAGEALGEAVGGGTGDAGGAGRRGPGGSPLAGPVSDQRRLATVTLPLDDLEAVRALTGHRVHDVLLAVVAGGLRGWLLTRGEQLPPGSTLTALVPGSVPELDARPTALGVQVTAHRQPLPVGEPDAASRLTQVAAGTAGRPDAAFLVGAAPLTELAGFAPPTLHALGLRAVAAAGPGHDLVISDAPGPRSPRYLGQARLTASWPLPPLSPGHLLAVGLTSYDGEVRVGLVADRDRLPDLEVLAGCLVDALAELLAVTPAGATHRVRTSRVSGRAASRRGSGAAGRAPQRDGGEVAVLRIARRRGRQQRRARAASDARLATPPSAEDLRP